MSAPKLFVCLFLGISLIACGSDDGNDTTSQTTTSSETGVTTTVPATNPYAPYDGSCPTFVEGENTAFQSAGLNRTVQIRLPVEPVGAPVVFGWHWLGGNANQTISTLGLDGMANEGAIVVAPESSGLQYEWDYMSVSDSVDATLFDDLLWCLWEQYQVDDQRIYATGMSAGGLMTTFLIIARSEQLAAALPFSGGLYAHAYQSPTENIPVMMVWGGPSDTYGTFSFDVASQDFSDGLQADGHFVVECEHTGGHTIPNGADDMAWLFFQDHPKSIDAEPWISALPSELPSYCALP